jgi:DNA-binding CsgD family transcriptional regulator
MTAYLTQRETHLLVHLAEGNTCQEAGFYCGMAEQTVKNHLAHARQRTHTRSTVALIVWAHQHGYVDLDAVLTSQVPDELRIAA